MKHKIRIDGSYFDLGPGDTEIWPSKYMGLVQGEMGKAGGQKNAT